MVYRGENMTKIVLLGSSEYAVELFEKLKRHFQPEILYFIHDNNNSDFERRAKQKLTSQVLHFKKTDNEFWKSVKKEKPDIFLSINFMTILPEEIFTIPKIGSVNLHPSYLPYNRGNWPETWSIIEDKPAGVSLHMIDKGIDTGPIIAQEKVAFDLSDTAESLGKKVEIAGVNLLKNIWPSLCKGEVLLKAQDKKYKLKTQSDFKASQALDLHEVMKVGDVIKRLCAYTMPEYAKGCYFHDPKTKEKIYIRCILEKEDVR